MASSVGPDRLPSVMVVAMGSAWLVPALRSTKQRAKSAGGRMVSEMKEMK